jgi:MFS family permease
MSTISSAAVVPAARTLSIGGLLVLGLGALDLGLELSIVLPALPALADHYNASLIAVAWLATGFLLASVVAVPLVGRLGDLFGKRLMILGSLGAFAIGSLMCALTDWIGLAIAGRIVQGLGAAVAPLTYALVRDTVEPERLPRAIGIVVGAASTGGTLGFLLSGVLVDHFSAAAIFWLLFAIALVVAVAIVALVPESPVRARVPIDVGGAVLLGSGLLMLLLGISKGSAWGWLSVEIVGIFAASVVLLACFVLAELRVRQPLVDLGLFVTRPFADANVCAALFGYSFFLTLLLVPQIAASPTASGYGLGYSTLGIGLILLPTGLAALGGGWAAGRIMDRVGPRALVAAASALGIAAYVFLTLSHDTAVALTTGSAAVGLAIGAIMTSIFSVVARDASTDKTAIALAVNSIARTTTVAVGAQVTFALIADAGLEGAFPAEAGYARAFLMGAVGAGFALLASARLPGRASTRP